MDGDRVLYIQRSFDEGGVQSIVRGTIGGRGREETLLSREPLGDARHGVRGGSEGNGIRG